MLIRGSNTSWSNSVCLKIKSLLTVLCTFQESEHLKADGSVWKPFEGELPDDNGFSFEMVDGVFQVMGCKRNINGEPNSKRKPLVHPYPHIEEFMEDQNVLLALSTHGPV